MDLDTIIGLHSCEVTIKKPVAEDGKDAELRRFKDKTLFIMAIAIVASMFIYCGYRLIEIPDDKFGMSIVTAISSGLIGYLSGKKSHN